MIRIGPDYEYRGEQLTAPGVFVVTDHHYNENSRCFPIKQLLDNSLCNPHEHHVIFDHVVAHEDVLSDYNLSFVPGIISRSEKEFNQESIAVDWSHKCKIFNFMINKPRKHREFLLRMIQHFDLKDFCYSLCWSTVDNLSTVENNKYSDFNHVEIDIPPRQFLFGHETIMDKGIKYGHKTNAQNYTEFLKEHVFEPTCISLITEPAFYERETIVTEKTIMAMWGGTVPIWVGGWRIADFMRSEGFDVFDDIIDHSYQDLNDPWDRCYFAVERNLSQLSDRHWAQNFIQQNQARLQHNLDLLKMGHFQRLVDHRLKYCDKEIQTFFTKRD